MKKIGTFYNVMPTNEGDQEATILIYNYIGEMWGWDPQGGYSMTGTTDIGFARELDELAKKYAVIHVRINSLGGEIFHGNAIVNAIKNCKAEVQTWNDGVCASMAAIIWMAGKKRHMASNALMMLHSASMICWGNASEMREMADTLDQFDNSLISGAADSLGVKEDELRANYFDGKDHWLTFNQVKDLGWASKEDDYPAGDPLPQNKALNYRELMASYENKMRATEHAAPKNSADAPDSDWVPAPLRKIFEDAKSAIREIIDPSSSSNSEEMNIEEFKKSLADGKISLEEVQNHLTSLAQPPAAPAPEANADLTALTAKLEAMEASNKALEAKVTALGAQPGASRSNPELPDNDAPGAEGAAKSDAQLLEEANSSLLAAAQAGDSVKFTPAIRQ